MITMPCCPGRQVAVDEDDLRDGQPLTSKATVVTYLEKHALYFQEISLQGTVGYTGPSLETCVSYCNICLIFGF